MCAYSNVVFKREAGLVELNCPHLNTNHPPTHPAARAQLETKLGSDKAWKAGGDQFGDSRLICEGDLQQLRRETEFTL